MNNTTCMLGALAGDIAGSFYERFNIKFKPVYLIDERSRYTDDSVLTIAVAKGMRDGIIRIGEKWYGDAEKEKVIQEEICRQLSFFGRRYEDAGYGGRFYNWIWSDDHKPYGSYGNGSAMRASYSGYAANTLEEAERLAELSAEVTHNHPDGINGAKVVAGCIYLLRSGCSKHDIETYAGRYYSLGFTLDEIRPSYRFDVSCRGSVPQAIRAFLEGNDFDDVLRLAISIGGDSDTIAAIAGSIAEPMYEIEPDLIRRIMARIPDELKVLLRDIGKDFSRNDFLQYMDLPE